jgi:TRAP-type C4-dicarboxylate transport system permease small subunit
MAWIYGLLVVAFAWLVLAEIASAWRAARRRGRR